jgi:hypothetical protein
MDKVSQVLATLNELRIELQLAYLHSTLSTPYSVNELKQGCDSFPLQIHYPANCRQRRARITRWDIYLPEISPCNLGQRFFSEVMAFSGLFGHCRSPKAYNTVASLKPLDELLEHKALKQWVASPFFISAGC